MIYIIATSMHLNDNIKLIRELSGLKQVDFARLIKTNLSNLKTYENTDTRPKANILAAIAKVGGISVEELDARRLKAQDVSIKVDKVDERKQTENAPPAAFLGITAQEYIEELRRDKRRLENVIDANLTALATMLSALHRHDLSHHQVMLRSLARLEGLKESKQLIEEADRSEAEIQLQEIGRGKASSVGK